MEHDVRIISESAKNQLQSSLLMLKTLIEVCDRQVWYEYFYGVPFWYQVYHVAYFIDYWLRDDFTNNDFRSMNFDERIPPEFETAVDESLSISQADMLEYVNRLFTKTAGYFKRLTDKQLAGSVTEDNSPFTYADIIMTQLRHIMYNIGYLNGILRSRGLPESDWYTYNEE